jgi:hypothetical protein
MSRMPKTNRATEQVNDYGPVAETVADLDGYTVNFVTFKTDIDGAPLLKGLPNDQCQCPHWGYVQKGSISFGFDDHVEVFEAGDAFYVAGGHTNAVTGDTDVVMFSPTDLLAVTEAQMRKNMQAMQPS